MRLSLADIRSLPHIAARGCDPLGRKHFRGVATDSRLLKPGDLFIALRGEHFDGHTFLAAAESAGAAAAIADVPGAATFSGGLPMLVVEDTVRALGQLAANYRTKFDIPVLCVGGSNGKTTTKEMIAAVLRVKFKVHATEANHNNHIGVPMTLLGLDGRDEIAVVELGTIHPGELKSLCDMAAPSMALITNIGAEHLEFFDSIDGVETEEGYLFESLRERKSTLAFVNADDERVRRRVPRGVRTVRYGFSGRPGVRGILRGEGDRPVLEVRLPDGKRAFRIRLPLPGQHNAYNALAAAAVGVSMRVPVPSIVRSLEGFRPVSKRMETQHLAGITLLNDCYNANPGSMLEALRTLASYPADGKRIAVLGDMLELGRHAAAAHARLGDETAALGIDYLLTFGPLSKNINPAAHRTTTYHYDQKNILAEYLSELLTPGDVVLLKGSRGMKLEDVASFLQERSRGTKA